MAFNCEPAYVAVGIYNSPDDGGNFLHLWSTPTTFRPDLDACIPPDVSGGSNRAALFLVCPDGHADLIVYRDERGERFTPGIVAHDPFFRAPMSHYAASLVALWRAFDGYREALRHV